MFIPRRRGVRIAGIVKRPRPSWRALPESGYGFRVAVNGYGECVAAMHAKTGERLSA